jgi:hypothetical protein
MVGLFPHTSPIGDQSQGKATQRRTSPPKPAESESEPARIARSHTIIGEDPRNFTLAHSPFLATVDLPSLAAGSILQMTSARQARQFSNFA